MKKHHGWNVTHFYAMEFCIPYQPRTSAKIKGHLRKTIIHWQTETVTLDTAFVTECFTDGLTQGNTRIFDCMMLVYNKIPYHINCQIAPRVAPDLIKHMIEKTQSS